MVISKHLVYSGFRDTGRNCCFDEPSLFLLLLLLLLFLWFLFCFFLRPTTDDGWRWTTDDGRQTTESLSLSLSLTLSLYISFFRSVALSLSLLLYLFGYLSFVFLVSCSILWFCVCALVVSVCVLALAVLVLKWKCSKEFLCNDFSKDGRTGKNVWEKMAIELSPSRWGLKRVNYGLRRSQDRFSTPNPQVCPFYFLNLGQKEKSLLRKPDSPA